ncbi:thioredoxin family protein [Kribbella sp. NPDC004536]|uniref:thioredoxin family protein n=1 Tax=Kribbella sp. NPDC004536 TaxID=3364106 RepID=UPI00368017BA
MRLEVLHVSDCPHVWALLDRLAEVTDVRVTTRLIETAADAERYGMVGSPTLLVDGVDPFGGGGRPGMWCRLGVPSVEELRAVTAGGG